MFLPQILFMFFGMMGVDMSQCVESTQRSPYGFEITGYYCPLSTDASPAVNNGTPIHSRSGQR